MTRCTVSIRPRGRSIHASREYQRRVWSARPCRRVWSTRRARVTCALAEDETDERNLDALDALLQELTARRRDKEKELHAVEALISAAQHKRDDVAMQTSE